MVRIYKAKPGPVTSGAFRRLLPSINLGGTIYRQKQIFRGCSVLQVHGDEAHVQLDKTRIGLLRSAANLMSGDKVDVTIDQIVEEPDLGPVLYLKLLPLAIKPGRAFDDCRVTAALGPLAFVRFSNGSRGVAMDAGELNVDDRVNVEVVNTPDPLPPELAEFSLDDSLPFLSVTGRYVEGVGEGTAVPLIEATVENVVDVFGGTRSVLRGKDGEKFILPATLILSDTVLEEGMVIQVGLTGRKNGGTYVFAKEFYPFAEKLFEALANGTLFIIGEKIILSEDELGRTWLVYASNPIYIDDQSYYPRGIAVLPAGYDLSKETHHFRLESNNGKITSVVGLIRALAAGNLRAELVENQSDQTNEKMSF